MKKQPEWTWRKELFWAVIWILLFAFLIMYNGAQ